MAYNLDQYIGDPGYAHSSSYTELVSSSEAILGILLTGSNDLQDFTRVMKFYDNVVFKSSQDFIPARSNTSAGIIIKPHLLERNKTNQVEVKSEEYINLSGSYTLGDTSSFSLVKQQFTGDITITGSINSGSRTGSDGGSFEGSINYSTAYSESVITPDGLATYTYHNQEEPKYDGEFSGSELTLSTGELNEVNTYKYDSAGNTEYKYLIINESFLCGFGISGSNETTTPAPTTAPTTSPTPSPTNAPVTPPPTTSPTPPPTTSPTPPPTNAPTGTPPPTTAPVTPPPTSTPTAPPVTPPPTTPPTPPPTPAPSTTPPPTSTPTAPPVTPPPTEAPTEAPVTPPPTEAPTEAPVTPPPTNAPTEAPVTPPPTEAPTTPPPTEAPTEAPVTPPPTNAPVTPPPTPAPVSCTCYLITNEGADPNGSYSYFRCSDGATITVTIAYGNADRVCARALPVDNGTGLTISSLGSSCTDNDDCTLATPPPTTAPTPSPATPAPTNAPTVSYQYLDITRCDGGTNNYTIVRAPSGTFPTNSAVLMPDGACYEVIDPSASTTTQEGTTWYSDCIACGTANPTSSPTAAPVTPAPITCNAISLEGPELTNLSMWSCSTSIGFFINTSDWCTATALYTNSGCTTGASAGWYTDGNFTRHWNGSAFTTSCSATTCE